MHKQSTLVSAGLCAGLLASAAIPAWAAWTLNDARTQLTDGNWTLTVTASGQDLTVTASAATMGGDLDLADVGRDTDGYRVTAIARTAFNKKGALITSVRAPDVAVIADGINSIAAFLNCTALTNVSFAAATSVGHYAFYGCKALADISFPAATAIGNSAFLNCAALTEVSFPLATSVGDSAFQYSSKLADIAFPALTAIGSYAFNKTALTSLPPLPNLVSIGSFAFDGVKLKGALSLPALETIGPYAFRNSAFSSLSAPALVSMGKNAFYGCANLTDVEFGAALSTIGEAAFSNCEKLKTFQPLTLPGLTTLGPSAFTLNNVLEGDFVFPALETIGNGAFNCCYALTSVRAPAATKIGSQAFRWAYSVTNVEFSAAVTNIGSEAFITRSQYAQYLSRLETFAPTALTNLDTIGTSAFNSCRLLTGDFDLPLVTNLPAGVFSGARKITSVRAPQASDVGASAFYNCTALTNVTLLGGGVLGNDSIRNVQSGAILRFFGEAPSSVLTNAITAASGNYPQIHVSRVRNLAGWTAARDDLAFTPLTSVAAADEAKLGDSPPRRTLGLITGLDTGNGIRAWLVDADTRKQTVISVQ